MDPSEANTSLAASGRKTVIIALPGRQFSDRFLLSLVSSLYALWNSNKYNVVISPGYSSFVSHSRMKTLGLDVQRGADQKPFPGIDYDYWISIDSDMVFSPEQIFELLNSLEEHPVVSGLYRMLSGQFVCVREWDLEYFKAHGTFQFSTPEEIKNYRQTTGLKYLDVQYCGMGFIGVRREALEALKYPYFDYPVTEIQCEDGRLLRDISSEDVAFCKNLLAAGYPTRVNMDLVIGHEKAVVI